VSIGTGLAPPPKLPPALAKKLDRRNSEREERKGERKAGAPASEDATALVRGVGADAGLVGDFAAMAAYDAAHEEARMEIEEEDGQLTGDGFEWAGEQGNLDPEYTDDFEVDDTTAEEKAGEGMRKEEAAYGQLLETLREVQREQPPPQQVAEEEYALLPTNMNDDGDNGEPALDGSMDEDLVAAGVMSGVDETPEAELLAMMGDDATPSAHSIRRLLTAQLGQETFAAAHARLQNVVEEDDDDVLVNDLQQILGPGKLKMLPMILKLIFIEEQK